MKSMWSRVLRALLVRTKASRWRRASKCKHVIKQAQLHLTIQKARKDSIIRQSRADIALLLQNGQLDQALARVGRLYKDQNLLAAYDQVKDFCECIITNFPDICKQSDVQSLPADVRQAMANLMFAASRCGELPELHLLRRIFRERYGYEFETANVELRHENLVSSQMKQNLCINVVVPEDEKLKLIREISGEGEHALRLGFRDSEQSSKMQCQEKNSRSYPKCKSEQRAEVMDLDMHDMYGDNSLGNSNGSRSSTRIKKKFASGEYQETSSATTSPDGMPRTPEMSIVYLDDLEEKSVNQEHRNFKICL